MPTILKRISHIPDAQLLLLLELLSLNLFEDDTENATEAATLNPCLQSFVCTQPRVSKSKQKA